jgi:hypothetical protein
MRMNKIFRVKGVKISDYSVLYEKKKIWFKSDRFSRAKHDDTKRTDWS